MDERIPILSIFDGRSAITSSLERAWGLQHYARIIHRLKSVDVSVDTEYQKEFNRFFRVRRNSNWRKIFYDELERLKFSGAEFKSVLNYLYEKTGFVEASFSSKLVATIDPTKPILDSRVLAYLGLRICGSTPELRLSSAVEAYDRIVEWYREYLSRTEAVENIKLFDSLFPDYTWISDVKKIDFLLWSLDRS